MSAPSGVNSGPNAVCVLPQVELPTLDDENVVEVHEAMCHTSSSPSITPAAAQNFLVALQEQHALKPNSFKIVVDDTIITVRPPPPHYSPLLAQTRLTLSSPLNQSMSRAQFTAAMRRTPRADVMLIRKL